MDQVRRNPNVEVIDLDEDQIDEIVPANHPEYAGLLMDADHQSALSDDDDH